MFKIDLVHPQIKASGLQSLLLGHSYLGHTQAKVKLGTGEPYQIHIFSAFSKQNVEQHSFWSGYMKLGEVKWNT